MIIRWWSYEFSLIRLWGFRCKLVDNKLFCANLQNIYCSWLLCRWFVDNSLERHIWNIENFDGNFFDPYCFCWVRVWIIDVSLLLHLRFVDDFWRYIDVTAKISLQALMIFKVFSDLSSKILMFPCYFVVDSLMILWRDLFETLIISMETFLISIVFVVLTSESFMFHWFFSDDSLMTLWRNIDDTTKIWMQTVKVIEVSIVIVIRTWMFLCCLID